jgi:anti-sigma B factor antagonist
MDYTIKTIQDVTVFELEGSVWGDWESIRLRDDVKGLLEDGNRKFLIDLTRVRYISSAGIGILVATYSTVANASGAFKVCHVNQRSRRALETAGIWSLLDTHETCREALMALGVGVPGLRGDKEP